MSEPIIQDLLNEIIRNRTELTDLIKSIETNTLEKVEVLGKIIDSLEKENKELQERTEILERNSKRKNLLIFGLDKDPKDISVEFICETFRSLLNFELAAADIADFCELGNDKKSPIKVEFLHYSKKILVGSLERKSPKRVEYCDFPRPDRTAMNRTKNFEKIPS
ncbi:hypothetical protein HHI36_001690 [Cryptolaemus montrouzieri]|uniref:Uncharacterized protein n=1 Tax=Cryptolaemus montrouzieri TaxID=559131 RepID=A0ABD2P915_9CUCU